VHPVGLGHDPCAFHVAERGSYLQRHVELPGKLDAARVHDPRADAGQFQHLVVADGVQLARFGDDARVGGVDAVNVGVDFAADLLSRSQGTGSGVSSLLSSLIPDS